MHDNSDLPADALRRDLRDIESAHLAGLPVFDNALKRSFDPDSDVPAASKAALVGLPDRRGFLKIGGLSVAFSALAVACVNEEKVKTQLPITGTILPPVSTSVPPNPGSSVVDATLLLTAISIEQLAIDTYNAAIDAGWLHTALLQDVAKYFRDQHEDHRGLLASSARALGQKPDDVKANAYLLDSVVKPATEAIASESGTPNTQETDTLRLALELEDAAAQTYAKAGGILTTAELRQAIMSIGATEARHFSLLSAALVRQVVPFAFQHTTGAAPPESYIEPDVATIPSTTAAPAPSTTTTTKATTTSAAK